MIDTKKVEELMSRKMELFAEADVYIAIGEFIRSNMDRCQSERNYTEWKAWIDALNDVTAKLKTINEELESVRQQLL